MTNIVLQSIEDTSINYINKINDNEYFESRFVQRDPFYFIVYLSSHAGCNQACRHCHLTQTSQTSMVEATLYDYIAQAKAVLEQVYFKDLKAKGLKKIKFSFMSRGEPLLNSVIQDQWPTLKLMLRKMVPYDFDVEYCISTIFPKTYPYKDKPLHTIFNTPDVTLYCSIYSVTDKFRKRWLGNSLDINSIESELKLFSELSPSTIKFHSAFIKGENDCIVDAHELSAFKNSINPNIQYNIIKYNPYSVAQGEETDSNTLYNIKNILNAKMIERVGFDVKASCGMFYKG